MSDMETSRKKRKLTTKQGVVIGVATVAGLGLLTKLFSFLRRDKQPKNLSDAELESLEAVLSGDAASGPVSAQAEIVRSTPKFANLEADDNDEEKKPIQQQLSTDATVPETEASKSLEVPHFNGDLHSNGDAVIAKSTSTEVDEEPHLDNRTEPLSQIKEELIEVAEKLPTEDLEKLPVEKLPIRDVEKAPEEDHVEANGNSVQAHIEDVAEKLATDEPKAEPQPSDHDAEELAINHAEVKPQASENEAELFEINHHAEAKPQSKEDDAEVKVQSREVDAEVKPQASEHDAEELAVVKPQASEHDAEELVINHSEEKPHSTKHEEQSREEDDAEHVGSSYKIVSAEEPEVLTKAGKVSVGDAGKHETEASDEAQL